MMAIPYAVVVPTIGRSTLSACLAALADVLADDRVPVVLVDDRPAAACAPLPVPAALRDRVTIVYSCGHGPAAARNAGWRAVRQPWVVFLDDDTVPGPGWAADLAADLTAAGPRTAGVQGRIEVPLPAGRRPTDWERGTAGLAGSRWITADIAYRRSALLDTGGFDERFPRAFREDADLALRLLDAGWELTRGRRTTVHPVRPAGPLASVRAQAGNADDVLMTRLHGPDWWERAGAPRGRLPRHAAVTAVGLAAVGCALLGRRRAAALSAAAWLAGTAEFALARIAPGPRTRGEVGAMVATSALIPAVATAQHLLGLLRHRRATPLAAELPHAVLFDRDGTLVDDVPYNGDPALVTLRPGAKAAVAALRARGIPVGVVSNQSGVARGLITHEQVQAVRERVDELLGPFDVWAVCPHGPDDGCPCRKPAPGLVYAAARALDVDPARVAVIGDIGADTGAAAAAGARGILVPTPVTLPAEIAAATEVAADLTAAVALLLPR